MEMKTYCSQSVYRDAWSRNATCNRYAKVYDDKGNGFCTQHSPAKQAERDQQAAERAKAERDQNEYARYCRMAGAWAKAQGMIIEDFTASGVTHGS